MKLTWYNKLYVGEKAKKKRYRIIQAIRRGKPRILAYVITPASNGNNILDIYPAAELLSPYCRQEEFFILGIAADYWEALSVAARIVDEMYRKTGGFKLEAFLDQSR